MATSTAMMDLDLDLGLGNFTQQMTERPWKSLMGNGTMDFDRHNILMKIYEQYRQDRAIMFIPTTILLSIISFVGVAGNILVMIVFTTDMPRKTSTFFIVTLAIIDFLICLLVIPGTLFQMWYYPFYYDALCKIWDMLRTAAIPMSSFILVAIAVDRYLLICFRQRFTLSNKHARWIIFTAILTGSYLAVPSMLAMGVYDANGTYAEICILNYKLISEESIQNYWIFLTCLYCVMILIVAILYFSIFFLVYQRSRMWKTKYSRTPNRKYQQNNSFMDTQYTAGNNSRRASMETVFTTDVGNEGVPSCCSNLRGGTQDQDAAQAQAQGEASLLAPGSQPSPAHASNKEPEVITTQPTANPIAIAPQENDNDVQASTTEKTKTSPKITAQKKEDREKDDEDDDDNEEEVGHPLVQNNSDPLEVSIKIAAEKCSQEMSDETTPLKAGENALGDPNETANEDAADTDGGNVNPNFSSPSKQNGELHGAKKSVRMEESQLLKESNGGRKASTINGKSDNDAAQSTIGASPGWFRLRRSRASVASVDREDVKKRGPYVKTAQILFTVTVVYVISYLPVFLVNNRAIPNYPFVFYCYFINNAANPIIYSFMNKKFRSSVKRMFSRKKRRDSRNFL